LVRLESTEPSEPQISMEFSVASSGESDVSGALPGRT
jgi:hypothetical protein